MLMKIVHGECEGSSFASGCVDHERHLGGHGGPWRKPPEVTGITNDHHELKKVKKDILNKSLGCSLRSENKEKKKRNLLHFLHSLHGDQL
jgi:hypothetical protein